MNGFISNSDKDSLMRASYYQITRNFTKTVNRFVAFKDEDKLIEIPHGIGQRSKFIDLMIKYFESLEEYEKCNKSNNKKKNQIAIIKSPIKSNIAHPGVQVPERRNPKNAVFERVQKFVHTDVQIGIINSPIK